MAAKVHRLRPRGCRHTSTCPSAPEITKFNVTRHPRRRRRGYRLYHVLLDAFPERVGGLGRRSCRAPKKLWAFFCFWNVLHLVVVPLCSTNERVFFFGYSIDKSGGLASSTDKEYYTKERFQRNEERNELEKVSSLHMHIYVLKRWSR